MTTNADLLQDFHEQGVIENKENPARSLVCLEMRVTVMTALEIALFQQAYSSVVRLAPDWTNYSEQFVWLLVAAPIQWWADLCVSEANKNLVGCLDEHFYKHHLKGWVAAGMV